MSSRTANNQIASGLINAITMPMMISSGIFFSYHNFPTYIESIVRYFPLTMLADGIRGIFIEGAGISEVWLPCLMLNLVGIVFFYIGLRIYKWD